jgi:predicted Zn-dependent peptidase
MEMQFSSEFGLKDYVAKIKAVNVDDIRKAAAKHLKENNICTAILNPKKPQ